MGLHILHHSYNFNFHIYQIYVFAPFSYTSLCKIASRTHNTTLASDGRMDERGESRRRRPPSSVRVRTPSGSGSWPLLDARTRFDASTTTPNSTPTAAAEATKRATRPGLTNADERRTGEWTDADGRGQKGRFGPDLALLFPSAKDAAPRRLPRRRSQKRLNGGISGVGLTLLRLREKPRIKRDKAIIIGAPGYPKVSLYDLWNVTMLRACILTKNKGLWI